MTLWGMGTPKHTISFKTQRNGKIQVIVGDEIELANGDDPAEIGALILAALREPPPPSTVLDSEVCEDAEGFEQAQPAGQTFADTDPESHMRAAIEGMIPGGTRILDFLQTISHDEGGGDQ